MIKWYMWILRENFKLKSIFLFLFWKVKYIVKSVKNTDKDQEENY